MKKIDAHAHIGDFGGWAGVGGAPEQLIALMDEYEIEKTVLCSRDHTGNDGVAQAAEKYHGRFIPLVYLNPLEGRRSAAGRWRPTWTARASGALS